MIGKKLKKNNITIALNLLNAKKIYIYPAFVSKHKPEIVKNKLFF